MRPRSLDEVVGQEQLVGPGGFLRRAVAAKRLPSLILWGPPGSGKTTLARLVAGAAGAEFFALSAVHSGVKEVREVVEQARRLRRARRATVLFIDEIHRFHRGQQDSLLPHVEDGTITLVGATTENPAHTVVAPLVSRCRVLVLHPLPPEALVRIVDLALADAVRGLGGAGLVVAAEVRRAIADEADGDARRALSTLEIAAEIALARPERPAATGLDDVRDAAQRRLLRADRQGDAHYDLASAFIKSLRGSDPDAAVYYLMRMIESGDDPLFAARRMMIFAAEDIGLADPRALSVALAAAQAFAQLGLPEGTLPLCEAALYLATAPKSNSVIVARDRAWEVARERGTLPIPAELRDSSAPLSKQLGHGKGYRYPHDEPGHHAPVPYLPRDLRGSRFYEPSDQGEESAVAERVKRWRERVDDPSR
ncbi:MAG: replication-associated recombination protein A [Acidobacteria bacterium]|nr:replication-associated recombination protein A [Acidobacteriota bacterium]